mmetsp:Transcript_144943/g.464503  ORF Transcript_144943/g.464503 Transcript_144943/m.464503 type:complete len:423 (-) Transcript_144943:1118-2386(-)
MPTRSGSPASFLKACAIKDSSSLRLSKAQSSKVNCEKSGSPSPMSKMFSIVKMSKSFLSSSAGSVGFSSAFSASSFFGSASGLASTSGSSPSFFSPSASFLSPSPSPSFFSAAEAAATAAAAAFFSSSALAFACSASALRMACLTGSFHSVCVRCHSASTFCQSAKRCLNQSPGVRSSILHNIFCLKSQALKCSSACAFLVHVKRTSSKPSSAMGKEKLAIWEERFQVVRSETAFFRKFCFFSSSVSSATGIGSSASSFSSSSSLTSCFISSSFGSSFFTSSSLTSPSFLASPSSPFVSASPSSFFTSPSCASEPASATALRASSFRRLSSSFLISSILSFCALMIFSRSLSRSFSALRLFQASSTESCFCFKSSSKIVFLKSAAGSPMVTWATFLYIGVLNFFISSPRSDGTRLAFTSMTT